MKYIWQDSPPYPESVSRFLTTAPPAGNGLNCWLLAAATRLRHHIDEEETRSVLLLIAIQNGRSKWKAETEVCRAVEKAFGSIGKAVAHKAPKWAAFSQEFVEAHAPVNGSSGIDALKEASPCKSSLDTEYIVDLLFPGDPFLCVGRSSYDFTCKRREELRGKLCKTQFIVPSPCLGEFGLTQEGKESAHCLENTGLRRFLVVEFDAGDLDQQAAIIQRLAQAGPLVMVVHSGGKSLHAWFYCEGESEGLDSRLVRFFNFACTMGADKTTWLRSQFVRMPNGRRDNSKRQEVIFFARGC